MAAVPLPNLVFGDLAEVETLRAGRGIYEVVFELNAQTSLRHAEEVDNITRPGLRGFRLMNPELLHCKKRTKMELEKAYRRMRDQCLAQCDQEISTLDMQIAFVKQMIAVPNVMLPHVGPPAEQRNQGVQRSMQLPAVYMPYQSYVIGPGAIPYQPPFPDISDRVASLFRDRFAQKAWWELNLVFLETRKQAAEEKKKCTWRGSLRLI